MALPAQKPPAGAPGSPPSAAAPPGAGVATPIIKLKKGEFLFTEGENSRAMYLVRNGMIRIFKKKGDSNIEIDTVRSGQIVGELAFLDGNPRSASGEALTDCEMMEISGPTFQAVLSRIPDWLKILLKTVVGRLRTASTRIRQLESASTAYDLDKDGKRSAHYIYLGPTDVLKIGTGLLLVASRNGAPAQGGIDVRVGLLNRYVNQIMGIPTAKLTTFLDVLSTCGLVQMSEKDGIQKVVLLDIDFLENLVTYLNEEYLLESSKRHDISIRGFVVLSFIVKYLHLGKKDERTGLTTIDLGEIRATEAGIGGKDPFRMEEFPELVKLGYASQATIKSADHIFTSITPEAVTLAFRLQRVVMAIHAVNEQKRKGGAVGTSK